MFLVEEVDYDIEAIEGDLVTMPKKLRLKLREMEVADVSELLSNLSIDDAIVVLRLIPRSRRALVFLICPLIAKSRCLRGYPKQFV